MVGSGLLFDKIRKLAYELKLDIKFTDWQDNIENIYDNHDCLLVTSVNEGFGMVSAEAQMSGLCVFSVDTGGSKNLIKDGETGFTISRNVQIASSKIQEKLANRELLKKVSINSHIFSTDNFDNKRMNEKIYNLYFTALKF